MLLRLLLLLLPVLWGGALAKDSSYRLELKESVIVQESLCVLVQCKFFYSWSIGGSTYLYWFKKEGNRKDDLLVATNDPEKKLQERTRGRFLLLRDPKSKDCSLTIRYVNMRDSGTYYLHIENRLYEHTYEDKMLSLKVTALTHKPEILIPAPLVSGHPKKLTCHVSWACEEGTPPIFSWTSAAHSSLGLRSHRLSSVLNLTPRPQDHGTNLTCQVHFPATGVNVEKTIQLNVTYAPQDMAISIFQGNSTALKILQTTSLSILEGEALRLLCVADSNPPAELSWFRGSPGLKATPISRTSILELPRVGPAQEGEFTCQARHPLGPQSVSLSLSVICKPESRAGGVLGVVGGAGIMALALLSLCLCLVFRWESPGWFLRVKTCREKAAQLMQSVDKDVNPGSGSGSGSGAHQHPFWTDRPSAPPAPGDAGSLANGEQELHYAFVRFHNLKPQGTEEANTVYSEIKTHK
ncbi:sialic acid-binding Ig-like lectin 6 [Eptesicus fuscus]|uniref:sialic acid-binding Ig-like lectin 6 n=1 Tax=Eptesicus fuscus TaxID=29078 RepID=UPI002403D8A1|nr:sialic acid-binding Ig-like lectin 6 [Eptesicus fuscus]